MSTGKRLAKRSIIGTRVCAPGDDGKFYSGVISAVNTPSNGKQDSSNGALTITPQTRYQVRFDPAPIGSRVPSNKKEYLDRDLIGPGFTSVTHVKLVAGQKVFLTHNNREVQGSVVEHRDHLDEVEVVLTPGKQDGEKSSNKVEKATKRIDELRLMESRKSARLADSDTDFARLADVGSDRKRSSQANIDRPDNSNSPYHINNRSPNNNNNNNNSSHNNNNYKPRRRTQSEQSMRSDISDNHVAETTTTTMLMTNAMRTYKGNSGGSGNDSNGSNGTAYYADYPSYVDQKSRTDGVVRDHDMLPAEDPATEAARALITLSSPGKTAKFDDYRYPATYMMAGGMEESSSSGNSNTSGSESDNSWRSDTSSPHFAEKHWALQQNNHQQASSAPNSPNDEGIVADYVVFQPEYNKKRRFVMRAPAATGAADEDEEYVTIKPQHQPSKFVQTTKAKRGRPPTYRRRSPTPKRLYHHHHQHQQQHHHHEDAATDGDGEDSIDMSNGYAHISNGYSDNGKKYICTWSGGNGEPACGVTGNFNFVANHFIQRHNDKDEDMDFYVLEEGEYQVRTVEAKPTECGLPTQSHWDMVKPLSADPTYQKQIHRQMAAAAAAAANAHHSVANAEVVVNGGREIIYLESGSLSPRDDISVRQNMSPLRPANKPIKARASQQQRQFIINNSNPNSQNQMQKVSLVHINLGKMPQATRRGRSDVKKCRKVYGMGRKEMWCTQCKWKKACQRFHIPQPGGPEPNATEFSIPEPTNHPR